MPYKTVEKSWGRELIFVETEYYRGKIITIYKGKSFHLQRHKEKDETIYVLTGQGYIIRKDPNSGWSGMFHQICPGEVFRFKPGDIHKIWALPDRDLELVEVSNAVSDDDVEHLEEE